MGRGQQTSVGGQGEGEQGGRGECFTGIGNTGEVKNPKRRKGNANFSKERRGGKQGGEENLVLSHQVFFQKTRGERGKWSDRKKDIRHDAHKLHCRRGGGDEKEDG